MNNSFSAADALDHADAHEDAADADADASPALWDIVFWMGLLKQYNKL